MIGAGVLQRRASAASRLRAFEPAAWRLLRSGPGRATVAAGLLLLGALSLAALLEPHWRERAAELDAARTPAAASSGPAPWPEATAHAARVSTLLGLARRHDVNLRGLREDAAAPRAAPSGVDWRVLTLSAEGRYADLRAFAASALASDAALSLDSLVLQRADTATPLWRAEFGFGFAHAAAGVAAGDTR